MHNHNIFYSSNAQQNIFTQNTRSNFQNDIQKEHLNYIPDDDLEVGIKSITFDNYLKTAQIDHQETEPHIIIFQKKEKKNHYKRFIQFSKCARKIQFLRKA